MNVVWNTSNNFELKVKAWTSIGIIGNLKKALNVSKLVYWVDEKRGFTARSSNNPSLLLKKTTIYCDENIL